MKNIHFNKKTQSFFEGWYLKHDNGKDMVAFIPGINFANGYRRAFIQIITDNGSYNADFNFEEFKALKNKFDVVIGKNRFSDYGIKIDIDIKGFKCFGEIFYGKFTSLKYNIMGPLSIFPNLECNHAILSIAHSLSGRLNINGKNLDFNGGYGYIEKDWGRSFPKEYTWMHFRQDGTFNTVVAAVATVPFMKRRFKGHIAVVYENGRQYRFATYNFSKIASCNEDHIFLKKGKYKLKIFVLDSDKGEPLKAPISGNMDRIIFERVKTLVKIEFYKGKKLIFDRSSPRTSFENVKSDK